MRVVSTVHGDCSPTYDWGGTTLYNGSLGLMADVSTLNGFVSHKHKAVIKDWSKGKFTGQPHDPNGKIDSCRCSLKPNH